MKLHKLSIKTLISIIAIALSCFTMGFILLGENSLATASSLSTERILPISSLESYPLSSPVNVYADDSTVAIIQADNSLVIYQNNKFTKLTSSSKNFASLKQVAKFSDRELIVSDNGSVYKVDLDNLNVSLLTHGSELIGCTSFDFNGNYLVTAYGVKAFVYEVVDGNIVKMLTPLENVTDTTIAVNSTSVFYLRNNKIYCRDFADFESEREIFPVSPSKIIATDQFIYYILDGNIYRLTLDGSRTEMLGFPDSKYDLGKIQSATDIAISNDNLLVTDKENNSIQEFEIIENKLYFTGFAIAKGKTAYNRIANPKSIEKFGTTVAVLEDYKITIFDTNSVDYNEQTYKNLLLGEAPDCFAYSGKSVFGAFKDGNAYILDVNTEEKIDLSISSNVIDVCYKCSYYYALTSTTTSSSVYKIDENTGEIIGVKTYSHSFIALEVDVYNNYYLATSSTIYKDDNSDAPLSPFSETYGNVVHKMVSDLTGKLYILGNKSIFSVSIVNFLPQPKLYNVGVDSVKDFTISIDEASAYLLETNQEYLIKTDELDNVAISSLTTPSDFSLSGTSADVNSLKVYTTAENTNVFSVKLVDKSFEYLSVSRSTDDYLFIDELTVSNDYSMYLLANEKGLFVVDKNKCVEENLSFENAPTSAYTTTTVHAYYLPLITMEMEYALDFDGGKLLLDKHAEISPINTLSLFDMPFYYAQITSNGNTVNCYIPVNFTVEVLAENKEYPSFTIKQINATTLYSDDQLTDAITNLSKCEVRIYEDNGKVAKIAYLDGENWIYGYISSSTIIDTAKNSVRNVLIVLAVITSICGTATFFILKKFK